MPSDCEDIHVGLFFKEAPMQEVMNAAPSGKTFNLKSGRYPGHDWRRLQFLALPAGILLFVVLWAGVVWLGDYPAFILPGPVTVFNELVRITVDGTLWHHAQATLFEIAGGLLLGVSVATILGYILAKNPVLERLTGPYIVATQSIPAVAIAPLLVIWFGAGNLSRVLICALIVFFPILVNTIVGLRSVDPGLAILMQSLRASRWQTFRMLEVPAAMPVLLGGFKIGVTLSVIGAVVAEFVGAERGLGYLISLGKGLFNTPLIFAALITLSVISLGLYLLVSSLEQALLAWKK
jgi:NitT/TauT family transport system permease protein